MLAADIMDDNLLVEKEGRSKKINSSSKTIIEHNVLEASGDNQLESVRQLILRGMQLTSLDSACARRLRNVMVLSLSNNYMRDLEGFQFLVSLVDLNLNFNSVTSLQKLCCPRLQKLFLSNNLIAGIATLKCFPRLQILCLFQNLLPDLSGALEFLRGLAGLRELDLAGNPCAHSRGYQHRVLRSCPRLRELDGEEITQLDCDLSALFFEEQENTALWMREGALSLGTGGSLPVTTTGTPWRLDTGIKFRGCHRDGVDVTGEGSNVPLLPLRKAGLFPSHRLDNDPQLLTYLAQGVLADPCGSPREVLESIRRRPISRSSSEREHCCSPGGARNQLAFAREAKEMKEEKNQKEDQTRNGVPLNPSSTLGKICTPTSPKVVASTPGADGGLTSRKCVDLVDGMACGINPGRRDGRVVLVPPVGNEKSVDEGRGGQSSIVDRGFLSSVTDASQGSQREEEVVASASRRGITSADESNRGLVFMSNRGESDSTTEAGSLRTSERVMKDEIPGVLILSGNKPAGDAETVLTGSSDGEERERGIAGPGVGKNFWRGRRSPPQRKTSPPPPPPVPLIQPRDADLDPSNPYRTIRKLLKVIETLQLERAHLLENPQDRPHGDQPPRETWRISTTTDQEDVRRLRLENRNMHLLVAENRELKRQAREDAERAEEEQRGLRAEVESLRGRLRRVTVTELDKEDPERDLSLGYLRGAKPARPSELAGPSCGAGGSGHVATHALRRASTAIVTSAPRHSDIIGAESAEDDDDEELEELFRRNEGTMGQIRRDLELMRRETFGETPRGPLVATQQQMLAKSAAPTGVRNLTADKDEEGAKPKALVAPRPPDTNDFDTTVEGPQGGATGDMLIRYSEDGRRAAISTNCERIAQRDSTRREEDPPRVVELLVRLLEGDQAPVSGGTRGDGVSEGGDRSRHVDGLGAAGESFPRCSTPSSFRRHCPSLDGKSCALEEYSSSSSGDSRCGPVVMLARSREDNHDPCRAHGRPGSKGAVKAKAVKGYRRGENPSHDQASTGLGANDDVGRERNGDDRVTLVAPNAREILMSEDRSDSPGL